MSNKTRYAVVMIIGILMNQIFYTLAEWTHLPVWLDVCGTAFAAFVLEPTAGLLVGLANNFYLALFAYDSSTLLYYSISAAVALVAGFLVRRGGRVTLKNIAIAVLWATILSTVLSTLLAIWRSGGIPDVGWEYTAYQYAAAMGMPKLMATFCGTFAIKLLDSIASALIVAGLYLILPRGLKYAPEKPTG